MKKYIIAIDLHGTLLDESWQIHKDIQNDLLKSMTALQDFADFIICTGNDYSFVEHHVPSDVLKLFKGCILESGTIYKDQTSSMSLSNETTAEYIVELRDFFVCKNYSFVKYFGERQSTISLFTVDQSGGEVPSTFLTTVLKDFNTHIHADKFYVTWSNVAIDIIPYGFSKWTGINHLANDKKVISFLDSYNDKEIALNSDFVFLPSNSSPELIKTLRQNNKLVFDLGKFHFINNHCYLSKKSYTSSVLDGLKYLSLNLT
jgi:hydroxymethylpyrimidine pyrophosphatase-like HAD family hydrolase